MTLWHTTVPQRCVTVPVSQTMVITDQVLFKSLTQAHVSLHIGTLIYKHSLDCFKSNIWSIVYHGCCIVWALLPLLNVLNDFTDYAAHCYVHKLNVLLIPAKCVLSSSKPYLATQTLQLCFVRTQKKTCECVIDTGAVNINHYSIFKGKWKQSPLLSLSLPFTEMNGFAIQESRRRGPAHLPWTGSLFFCFFFAQALPLTCLWNSISSKLHLGPGPPGHANSGCKTMKW